MGMLPILLVTRVAVQSAQGAIFVSERVCLQAGVRDRDQGVLNDVQTCACGHGENSGGRSLTVHFCTTSRPRHSQP